MKVPEKDDQFSALQDPLHTLARAWSPRPIARLDPTRTHNYGTVTTLTATPPTVPWAMYLYTVDKQLGILAVDFDDHGADPRADCADLSAVLASLRCPHWIAASSGTTNHSRHLWIPLSHTWTAKSVRRVADALTRRYRSVDISALRNPVSGCLRPPGAPHRAADPSTIIAVAHPSDTTATAVLLGEHRAPARLPDALPLVFDDTPYDHAAPASVMVTTTDQNTIVSSIHAAATALAAGHTGSVIPHLNGGAPAVSIVTEPRKRRRRTRPAINDASAAAALIEASPSGPTLVDQLPEWLRSRIFQAPSADTSRTEFQVLRALAQQGWTDAMLLTLADRRPAAFTHSASQPIAGTLRRPRSDRLYRRHLLRQWDRAQHSLTTHPARPAHRDLQPVIETVAHLQDRADSDPDMQMTDGSATVRRVLDAICVRALTARTTVISIGCRDAAATAGIRSHQTAAAALRQLRHQGYVELADQSEGPHASTYRLRSPCTDGSWTQGGTTAQALHAHLSTKLSLFRHDILLHPGLGERAGLLLWATTHGAHTEAALTAKTGIPARAVRPRLAQLRKLHLLTNQNRPRVGKRRFETAAHVAGVAGAWAHRIFVWRLQQLRWRWWLAELAFLTAPKHHKRLIILTQPILGERGRYPRTSMGVPDHDRALVLLRMATRPPNSVAV